MCRRSDPEDALGREAALRTCPIVYPGGKFQASGYWGGIRGHSSGRVALGGARIRLVGDHGVTLHWDDGHEGTCNWPMTFGGAAKRWHSLHDNWQAPRTSAP